MPKHPNSYICFTLSLFIVSGFLNGEEKNNEQLVVSEETASVFGFGAAPHKDNSQKATNTEGCKNGESCKIKLEKCSPDIPSQLLYFKHIEAKGIGYKKGYSTVGAFLTPYTMFSDFLPFADLRGHVFNDGKFAANAGLGVKYLSNNPFVFGAGVYYDFRQVHKTHFNQVSLGLETLSRRWEARLNGYLPVGSKKHVSTKSQSVGFNFDHFAGHRLFYNETFFVKKKTEFAMKGADAEFGWHLLKPQENYTLYAAAGPYYYNGENKHAWGGKARLEGRITPYVTLEVSDSFDNIFHNIVQGQVSINLPFGGKIQKKNGQFKSTCSTALSMEARMMRPLYRQEIIVAHKKSEHFYKTVDPVAQSIYGAPLNFIFVDATAPAGGNGTFENPYNDIFLASTQTHLNDVIYISGDFSLSSIVDQSVTLLENQRLLGSSIPQSVPVQISPTNVTQIVIPPMTTSMPSITQGFQDNVVYIRGNNTLVSGINFNTSQNNTIVITNATPSVFNTFYPINSFTLTNSNLSVLGAGSYGIYLRSVTGTVLIQNNNINGNPNANNGQNGIYIEQFGSNGAAGSYVATVNILDNKLQYWNSASGLNAPILLATNISNGSGSVPGASVLNVLIQNNTMLNNTFSPAAGVWLFAGANSTINASVLNNISQANLYGMVFQAQDAATLNITACGNTCSNNLNQGFYISPVASSQVNITLCDNTVQNNGAEGILVTPNFAFGNAFAQNSVGVTALIKDNLIESNNRAGIYFTPQNGTVSTKVSFENNILLNNGTSNNYTFYVANGVNSGSSTSSMTIFMDGNINSPGYGLANFNSLPSTVNIEQGGMNDGAIDLIGAGASFNFVDRHTAAP